MFKIIHNPRCSKSREALKILEDHQVKLQIIHYLDGELSLDLLEEALAALKLEPREILRLKEEEFKSLKLDLDNKAQIKQAILSHPKILERPLIWKGKKGVIGRPPENVLALI